MLKKCTFFVVLLSGMAEVKGTELLGAGDEFQSQFKAVSGFIEETQRVQVERLRQLEVGLDIKDVSAVLRVVELYRQIHQPELGLELFKRCYCSGVEPRLQEKVLVLMGDAYFKGVQDHERRHYIVEKSLELVQLFEMDLIHLVVEMCSEYVDKDFWHSKGGMGFLSLICDVALEVNVRVRVLFELVRGEKAFDSLVEIYPSIRGKLPITDVVHKMVVNRLLTHYQRASGVVEAGGRFAHQVVSDIDSALSSLGNGTEVELEKRALSSVRNSFEKYHQSQETKN